MKEEEKRRGRTNIKNIKKIHSVLNLNGGFHSKFVAPISRGVQQRISVFLGFSDFEPVKTFTLKPLSF